MQAVAFTTAANSPSSSSSLYPRSLVAAQSVYARDGILGFYRGVTVPIYMNTAKRAAQYTVWDGLKERKLNPFLSGSLTGAFGTITFGCPAHVIKIHSQVIGNKNAFSAAKYIFEKKGVLGFYVGLPVNLAKDIVFAGCYLGLYEKYKQARPNCSPAEAAAVASCFVWTVFLPIDTLKTTFQSPDRTAALALLRREKERGARALLVTLSRGWAGLGPAILRSGPANAASMTVYEAVKSYNSKKKP